MAILLSRCPGAATLRGAPTLNEKRCPNCGQIIEIFSNDTQVQCSCGFVAYNDTLTCVTWCKYAKDCVGEEIYNRIMSKQEEK